MAKIERLEVVHGSTYCQFSVVENKLAAIARNQRRIYFLLQIIAGLLKAKLTIVEPSKMENEKDWEDSLDEEEDNAV